VTETTIERSASWFARRVSVDAVVSRTAALALGSQALASLSNFVTTVVAARAMRVEQFSAFVLVFTLVFLVDNLQRALVFKPMTIFGAGLDGAVAERHFGVCLVHQAGLAALVVAGAAGLCAALSVFSVRFCAGLLLFVPLFMFQQYFRFLFFTRVQTGRVFALDVIGHGLRIAVLLAATATGRLGFENIFHALAGPAALAALCGAAFCRRTLAAASLRRAAGAFGRFWPVSKWIVSYNVVVWLNANVFFFLVAAIAGMSAPGILKACINLLGPVNIFFMGLANVALPIASKRFHDGRYESLRSLVGSLLLCFVGVVAVYGAIVLAAPGAFCRLFYGEGNVYAAYAGLLPFFVVQNLAAAANQPFVIGMEAMRRTKRIFGSYLAGAGFSLVATAMLAGVVDLYGIAAIWCASSVVVTLLNWRSYRSALGELAPHADGDLAPAPAVEAGTCGLNSPLEAGRQGA
jgi:O-antigen/teichoic acid export membrane protein